MAGSEEADAPAPVARVKRPAGLGRGLSALLGDAAVEASVAEQRSGGAARHSAAEVAIADIRPHPEQPRRHFDEHLAVLVAADAGERLRGVFGRPAALGGQVRAGETH